MKIELPSSIFNVPIRRDIIHNVFRYERHLRFKRTKRAKTVGDVAGSGKKPRPQKHTGRARQGNIRAPLNYKGGVIFGAIPKDFKFPINKKLRLLAMKSILTSRLLENRIILVNDFQIDMYQTREFGKLMKVFDNAKVLVLHENAKTEEIANSSKNIPNITCIPAIVFRFIKLKFTKRVLE